MDRRQPPQPPPSFFFFFLFMLCHVMNLIHGSEKSRKDRGTVFQSTIESMFENKEKKIKILRNAFAL